MSGDHPTVADLEAIRVYSETGNYAATASELVRRGWTDAEVREFMYPALRGVERRLLDRTLEQVHAASLVDEDDADIPARHIQKVHKAGPARIVTLAEVEAVRDGLIADHKPHGYRSIAKAGGWAVITVRRRLEGN